MELGEGNLNCPSTCSTNTKCNLHVKLSAPYIKQEQEDAHHFLLMIYLVNFGRGATAG